MNSQFNPAMRTQSLYERLGSAKGISNLVDEILTEHMRNPTIQTRYLPAQDRPEHLAEVKKHVFEFFAAGTGGPEQYTGKSMLDAHRGMNINAAEYMAVLDDILVVLDRHAIDEQTRREVLEIAYSLKGEIMHV